MSTIAFCIHPSNLHTPNRLIRIHPLYLDTLSKAKCDLSRFFSHCLLHGLGLQILTNRRHSCRGDGATSTTATRRGDDDYNLVLNHIQVGRRGAFDGGKRSPLSLSVVFDSCGPATGSYSLAKCDREVNIRMLLLGILL
jgi:hypothetical protein